GLGRRGLLRQGRRGQRREQGGADEGGGGGHPCIVGTGVAPARPPGNARRRPTPGPRAFLHNGGMTQDAARTLLLIDGSSYLYRAYHAMPDLRAVPGDPTSPATGAIRGMINMMQSLRKE